MIYNFTFIGLARIKTKLITSVEETGSLYIASGNIKLQALYKRVWWFLKKLSRITESSSSISRYMHIQQK
jgi:molybdenum-dependent DNA-binding transcriptional regulator ModE